MSQDLYRALFQPGPTLLHAFAQAGRLRRAAQELASEEAESFVEEEIIEAQAWVTLTRLAAAEEGGVSRQLSAEPVPIAGAPGWAVIIRLDTTIDGAAMLHGERVRAGAPSSELPPPIQIRLQVDGRPEQLLIPVEEASAAIFLESAPQDLIPLRVQRE